MLFAQGDMRYTRKIWLPVAKTHVSPSRTVHVQAGPRLSYVQVTKILLE